MEPIRNKVAESGIITLDLTPFLPRETDFALFDLQPFLFHGLILKEKDYRAALQALDWSAFSGKHIALYCSTDAIIPVWAYMLAASYLQPVAASVTFGQLLLVHELLLQSNLRAGIRPADYEGARVVLKGCGDVPVPEAAYVAATLLLRPVVKSLMYGEPCSTVPVYKLSPARPAAPAPAP